MSKEALYKWVNTHHLPRPEKQVLRQLCHFADAETGEAWATVPKLAEETDYSQRAVQYALRNLEENGLIEDTGRKHKNQTRRLVPIYRLAPNEQLFRGAQLGEAFALRSPAMLRPQGCKSVHSHKKNEKTNISNEISNLPMGNVPPALVDDYAREVCPIAAGKYLRYAEFFREPTRLKPSSDTAGDELLRNGGRAFFTKRQIVLLRANGVPRE